MPLSPPNPYPPFSIARLSHVDLHVTDLDRARTFYVDTLGFACDGADPGRLDIKPIGAASPVCLRLTGAARPAVAAVSFQLLSDEDVELAAHWSANTGYPSTWVARKGQGRTLRADVLPGMALEFFASAEGPRVEASTGTSARGARPHMLSAVGLAVPDLDGATALWHALGFFGIGHVAGDATGAGGHTALRRIGGTACLTLRHAPAPGLHHVAFDVPNPLAILEILDHLSATGGLSAVEYGPGRHGLGGALFLYLRDPDGHRIALFCDGDPAQAMPDTVTPVPQDLVRWGPPPPDSWFAAASVFASD